MSSLLLALLSIFPIVAICKTTLVYNFNAEYFNDPKSYVFITPENITDDFGMTLCLRINMEVWTKKSVFLSEKLAMDLNDFKNPGFKSVDK